ncbi:MAG TPA: SDR family NAD(P)-dependent oxidoreductase [Candidatus Baltobacteraceae bacterium]|nr:SDR family NAD(P)-dependent oxidoreductase [Candidatus Baltobacteraceae bacterium]
MRRLEGKVALVTGCAGERGLGRGIATRLAAEGADLIITDVSSLGTAVVPAKPTSGWRGLESLAEEIRSAGRNVVVSLLDVRSAEQIQEVLHRSLAEFGRLDIFVNNAAAPPGADRVLTVELTEDAWDTVLDTNLKGPFLCARAAARLMLEHEIAGRIINIASDRAKVASPKLAAYCASKFGLIGFTQSLALELAPAGITVNAVCPGAVDSERLDYLGRQSDGSYDPVLRAREVDTRSAQNPTGRLTTPADVAEVVAFLASDGAAYITGQAINVTGGAVMH